MVIVSFSYAETMTPATVWTTRKQSSQSNQQPEAPGGFVNRFVEPFFAALVQFCSCKDKLWNTSTNEHLCAHDPAKTTVGIMFQVICVPEFAIVATQLHLLA